MTIKQKREAFIEIGDQMNACSFAQKEWDDETFLRTFDRTKDQALLSNIKVFRQKLFDIDE